MPRTVGRIATAASIAATFGALRPHDLAMCPAMRRLARAIFTRRSHLFHEGDAPLGPLRVTLADWLHLCHSTKDSARVTAHTRIAPMIEGRIPSLRTLTL